MKVNTTLIRGCISFLILVALFFASCQKSKQPYVTDISKTANEKKAELMSLLSKEGAGNSFKYFAEVYAPGKGFYSDLDGNKIDLQQLRQQNRGYECPDPGDEYYSEAITGIGTSYSCDIGYRVEVTCEVSVLYNLVGANPANAAQLSRGRIRLKNSGGTVVYSNTNVSPVTITSLGPDPSDPTLNLFRVVFTTNYINETTFNSATTIEASLFCYTDCANIPTISTGYSSQQAIPISNVNYIPCQRVDKVGYSPTTNAVFGCNAIPSACYPWGYVFPDRQEIQWFNGTSWLPLNLVFFGTTNGGIIYTADLWYIDIPNNPGMTTGAYYQVRYRNRQVSGTGAPCVTNIWVEDTWHIL